MGYRISKVYTRTGDDGSTSMADGSRVSKTSAVMQAIGDIDELNACIGVLRAEPLPKAIDLGLLAVQNELFSVGGELAMPEYQTISQGHIDVLEKQIDSWNNSLEPLKEFILPSGNRPVALCHVARTVCRRAERGLVLLKQQHKVRDELLHYVNRLSDYLFVAARTIGKANHTAEVYWQQNTAR
ncbi:MAG: cob(I)yrinic acid a,c-diamide adenosyltransferase [Gammaproteobacteria bacterium]|nr:MAG: cob(I)yrinic acid a,c-diamide adenosyltransferase [Gammaproteobacteria bacterium]